MAGKYAPLEKYLRELPANQMEVTLGFEHIEKILGSSLPSSAYEDRRWWDHEKEGNHVNARAWANAGWKVDIVDFSQKWVKLVRVGSGVQSRVMMTPPQSKDPLHGVTLEMMLTKLVQQYGWVELSRRIPIRCFYNEPTIKSSLKFLRRTPWARKQVEELYLASINW